MRFILTALALTIVLGPRADARSTACRSGLEVTERGHPNAVAVGHRYQRTTADGVCTFQVRLCANAGPPTCKPRRMASAGTELCRGGPDRDPPSELDAHGSCGPWTDVTMPLGRRRLRLTTCGAAGRRRLARVTLKCTEGSVQPPPGDDSPAPPGDESPTPPAGARACEGITGRALGRIIDFPPSLPIQSCGDGGTSSNYVTPAALLDPAADAELHVIGVYETAQARDGGPPHGLEPPPTQSGIGVTVHPTSKPVALVLLSYEAVRWTVTVDPGASVERVITSSYEPSVVEGLPSGTPTDQLGPDATLGYAYGWELAANDGGGSFLTTIHAIRARTGIVESSFQGCYSGDHFEIPHWTGDPPTCVESTVSGDESIALRAVQFPGCESVTAESQYCLTTAGGSLALLGIDSGAICPVATAFSVDLTPENPMLAWRGEIAYLCTGDGLVRVSLRDGAMEAAGMPCGAVASDDTSLLVETSTIGDLASSLGLFDQSLYAFSSWANVLAGESSAQYSGPGLLERVTVHAGIRYSSWFSTGTIDRADLQTGEALPSITLEGYNGWILGLSVTDDGRLLVSGDMWGDTVYVFDVATGQSLGVVRPAAPVTGLVCVTKVG